MSKKTKRRRHKYCDSKYEVIQKIIDEKRNERKTANYLTNFIKTVNENRRAVETAKNRNVNAKDKGIGATS